MTASTLAPAATRFIAESRTFLGYTPRPPQGGETPFGQWYCHRQDLPCSDYAAAAWCDMFVSYCAWKTAAHKAVGVFASTPQHAQWFQDQGRFNRTPRPASLAFFDWHAQIGKDGYADAGIGQIDHVAIVERLRPDLGVQFIQTIEGNTDHAVRRRVRHVANIVGYGHPDWETA